MIVADVAGCRQHSRPPETQLLADPAQAAYGVYLSQHAGEVAGPNADQLRNRVHLAGELRYRRRPTQEKPLQATPVEPQSCRHGLFRSGQADPSGQETGIEACRRHDRRQVHLTC